MKVETKIFLEKVFWWVVIFVGIERRFIEFILGIYNQGYTEYMSGLSSFDQGLFYFLVVTLIPRFWFYYITINKRIYFFGKKKNRDLRGNKIN